MRIAVIFVLLSPLAGQTPEAWFSGSIDAGYRFSRISAETPLDVVSLWVTV